MFSLHNGRDRTNSSLDKDQSTNRNTSLAKLQILISSCLDCEDSAQELYGLVGPAFQRIVFNWVKLTPGLTMYAPASDQENSSDDDDGACMDDDA
jgi:hypothetical protein